MQKEILELKESASIDEFIHLRANALEVLSQIAKRLGIIA